jgi:hypothetical protein
MSEEKIEPYNLGMKSILNSSSSGEAIRNYFQNFTRDWIFDKWFEKLIVLGSFIWLLITIGLLILGKIRFI